MVAGTTFSPASLGWEIEHTGGNCVAWLATFNGCEVLVTTVCGEEPEPGSAVLVSLLMRGEDSEPRAEVVAEWNVFVSCTSSVWASYLHTNAMLNRSVPALSTFRPEAS